MKKNKIFFVALTFITLVGIIHFINVQVKNNKMEEVVEVGGKLVAKETMNEFKEINLKLVSFIEENNTDTETQISAIRLDINKFPKRYIYIDVLTDKPKNTKEIEEHYLEIIEKAKTISLLNKENEVEFIIQTVKK
ncbi:hypothetical protein [Lysinibacillus sp. SGAir0095]|uniref:hypothetical protein n=1 Tax=Lysinibacillus sp. SGAir0095 TaxID=2070463 RepID=UPI0010CCED5E|nr:hypothetical protein [Lysinibacillus sp. SGAir0095]QCR33729.1 hypothetical protein C1N55_16905 [Lysinibacillus sp. SGAir0095]